MEHHVCVIKYESQMLRPDLKILKDKLAKTKKLQEKEQFPCLRLPRLLLVEMKSLYDIDADKMVVTHLNKMASQIVARAPKTPLNQMCVDTIHSCLSELEKKGLELTTAILFLPSLFTEDSTALFVIDQCDRDRMIFGVRSSSRSDPCGITS
ncbi:UNVERIFIED_CONTAM: hypothetical protein FKN15_055944 [Acipenser sinensis]